MGEIGFIIIRHVNSELTNKYWIDCYACIRKFYPENKIVIIDDNSNYKYITDNNLYKTHIINSEYPGRGELLPYYYYLQNKWFDSAVIIHDSVFINKNIDFNVDKYKFIWEFKQNPKFDDVTIQTKMINIFNDKDLYDFYMNKDLWTGCFGCMSIVTYDFLSEVNKKYNLAKLLNLVLDRNDRCCLERVLACLFQITAKKQVLLGTIHEYCSWGIIYDRKHLYKHLPLIKVWTGR